MQEPQGSGSRPATGSLRQIAVSDKSSCGFRIDSILPREERFQCTGKDTQDFLRLHF
jgi:hypothetical protein